MNPVKQAEKMIAGYLARRTLHLPADYSAENAFKQAWLVLQDVKDRDQRLALQVCTPQSIVNALLDMAIQGLNPAKKQCYFIVYGKALTMQRSYFGDIAIAQRVQPGIDVYSGVVYEGDEFEIITERGRRSVSHRTKLENQRTDKIIAAYAGVVDSNGVDLGAEVMTFEQIKKSWGQSKTYKEAGGNTPHHSFPDQMALRTVIRRRLKGIINAANDELLLESMQRQERDQVEAEMAEEVSENANANVLTMEAEQPVIDAEVVSEETPEEPTTDEVDPYADA